MRCVPIIPFGAFRLPRVVGLADDELGPRPVAGIGPVIGRMRLPNDPVGMTTVTFDGVLAGCEIRIYDPDLNEVAGIESCADNQLLVWPVYASGSPRNNLRVKIINVAYRIKDFPYQARVGEQSISVQMEPDDWYSNPL